MPTLTKEDVQRGYYVCKCGKYAYVMSSSVAARLGDYSGELCAECGMWMCSVAKLREAGFLIPQGEAQ